MIASRIKARAAAGFTAMIGEGLRDLIFVGGGAGIVWGVHFWSVPAAWICGGMLGMYLAYASAPTEEGSAESIEISGRSAAEAMNGLPPTRRAA